MEDQQGDPRPAPYASYVAVPGWGFPAVIVGLMFVAGLAALLASAVSGGPWLFSFFFLFVVIYVGYQFLYRRAYLVRVVDDAVWWHGCRYHGSRPMKEVQSVRRASGSVYVWTFSDGTSMTMMSWARPSMGPSRATRFLDEVARSYPHIPLPGYAGMR